MTTPTPSNKFLNGVLHTAATALLAAVDCVEASVKPLQTMLTHRSTVSGQSPLGVNPTCDDVFNQVDLETVTLVETAVSRVFKISKNVEIFYKQVYPNIHQTLWERRRQSPKHHASTPAVYVPPPP